MRRELTAISLAPLHGTILSIIIGIFSAYALNMFDRLDVMRNDIFRDAAKINSIRVPGSFGLSGAPEYMSSNDEVRRKLLSKFTKLVMGVPSGDLPPSPSERGAEILRITSAISHYYPFPTRAKPNDQGGVSLGQIQPISFQVLDDIEKWIKDVDAIHGSVFWILDNHRGKLEEYLLHFQSGQNTSAFEVTLPEDVKSYLSPGARRDIEQSIKRAGVIKRHHSTIFI